MVSNIPEAWKAKRIGKGKVRGGGEGERAKHWEAKEQGLCILSGVGLLSQKTENKTTTNKRHAKETRVSQNLGVADFFWTRGSQTWLSSF